MQIKVTEPKCLGCHVTSGVCHLYTLCASCNSTLPKRAFSNHICSKKLFAVFCSLLLFCRCLLQKKTLPGLRQNMNVSCKGPRDTWSVKHLVVVPVTKLETMIFLLKRMKWRTRDEVEHEDTRPRFKRRKMSCDSVTVCNVTYRDRSANNYAQVPSDDCCLYAQVVCFYV